MNGVEQVIEACLLRERVTELAAEVERLQGERDEALCVRARDVQADQRDRYEKRIRTCITTLEAVISSRTAERDDLAARLAASERQRQALVEALGQYRGDTGHFCFNAVPCNAAWHGAKEGAPCSPWCVSSNAALAAAATPEPMASYPVTLEITSVRQGKPASIFCECLRWAREASDTFGPHHDLCPNAAAATPDDGGEGS